MKVPFPHNIPVGGPSLDSSPALQQRLDAVLDAAVTGPRLVGTVVIVMHRGKLVYRRAAGMADREAGRTMQEDAIFRLASLSKPIVSVAAMRLIEAGKLQLDAPITTWLPDFKPRLANGETPEITVRHLLTHTSGLTYGFRESVDSPYHEVGASDGLDHSGISLEDNLQRIAAAPLLFAPGQGWQYSMSIDVLGAVLAVAGNASLPIVVRQYVTAPLDMIDTGFHVTDPDRLAVPYADAQPSPVRMRGNTPVPHSSGGIVHFNPERALDPGAYPSGGAGMVGTADDFCQMLEKLRSGGGHFLDEATIRLMTSAQVGVDAASNGPGWGFGFGWAVLIDPKLAKTPQSVGTFHWDGAYGHTWFVDPSQELTMVAMTNTAFEGMSGPFTVALRNALYAST